MTFKEAVKLILRESKKPLTVKQLETEIKKHGLVDSKGKTQHLTIGAQITTDIKSKGELSDFKRVGPGKFVLNEKRLELEAEIKPDRIIDELEQEEEKEVEGGYIGKAGEHAVLSELLFRGYNAALMAVDIGVDILATKGSETFHIQVKTRNISKRHDAFHFNLRIVSFERHNAGKTFYIFVLRENRKPDYLILPLHEVEKAIEQEFVHVVGKGKLYRITITKREGKIYLGRRDNEVSYYLNRWDIIK